MFGMYNPLLQTLTLLEFLDSEEISSELKQKLIKSAAIKYAKETTTDLNQTILNQRQGYDIKSLVQQASKVTK